MDTTAADSDLAETTRDAAMTIEADAIGAVEATGALLPRPRTRWAAIIWGVVLGGIATASLWVLLDPTRRAGVGDWLVGLSPLSIVSYTILAIGALLLIAGLAGLARRAQARLAARSESADR